MFDHCVTRVRKLATAAQAPGPKGCAFRVLGFKEGLGNHAMLLPSISQLISRVWVQKMVSKRLGFGVWLGNFCRPRTS